MFFYGGGFDRVAGMGAELVDIAIVDILCFHCRAHIGTAFAVLGQDHKIDVGQSLDQGPVVAVAGNQNDGVDTIFIDLLAGLGSQSHVHLRLVLNDSWDYDAVDGEIGDPVEQAPAAVGVVAVHQENLMYLDHITGGKSTQASGQLDGIGVFAVHHHKSLGAGFDKVINVVIGVVAGIPNKAQILEAIFVGDIEEGGKFLVVIENVSVLAALPVDIALEGVAVPVAVVFSTGCFDSLHLLSVGHDEQCPNIVLFDPFRKQWFDIIDSVANFTVNVYEVLIDIWSVSIKHNAIPLKTNYGAGGMYSGTEPMFLKS